MAANFKSSYKKPTYYSVCELEIQFQEFLHYFISHFFYKMCAVKERQKTPF